MTSVVNGWKKLVFYGYYFASEILHIEGKKVRAVACDAIRKKGE
jgi:hypothetical protein